MTGADAVRVERDGPVTVVTLSRPAVRNAVDGDTAQALYQAFVDFDDDPQAQVAVFAGDHGHFCAGWDLQAGARAVDTDALRAALDFGDAAPHPAGPTGRIGPTGPIGPMGPSRLLLSKPVIAAVAGAAVAGGMELALWCDLRVMEDTAFFGVYCRRFGVPLIDGGTVRLPRLVGLGHAMDWILTGRRIDADEALRTGLANRVVPAGQARAQALALAHRLAAFPQATLRADRLSAYAGLGQPLAQALKDEWARGAPCIDEGVRGAQRFAGGAGRHGAF